MSRFQPRKASRHQLKARVAIDGPTGSGKTFTAIEWGQVLQGDGRTVVIDTERGSASWYCDRWDYDVVDWAPPYDPTELAQTIREAGESYAVVIVDSFSHFWEGEGGTLDIADNAGQRSGGNSFAGWKVATPQLRHLIDTVVAAPCHVITTMRSKMEYVLEEDHRGKKVPKKVGLAPVMRAGVEYEFTLIADMDLEHRLAVSKSRCSALADQVYQPGRTADAARSFLAWLEEGEALAPRADVDELVGKLNGLPESERKAVKELFVAEFGRPDFLTADRLDAARSWVDEATASVVTHPDGPGLIDGGNAVETGEGSIPPEATPEPTPITRPTQRAMAKLHATMADRGIGDDQRHAWASERLGRPIESFTQISKDDLDALLKALDNEEAS